MVGYCNCSRPCGALFTAVDRRLSPIADVFAGKIIGCPRPFKSCISVVEIVAGLAQKAIVDGQIPILMTLQALTDGGAVCSAVFDPVTKLEIDGPAVSLARSPGLAKDSWGRRQWNDFVRMFTDPASLTGLLVALVLAILAVLLIPAGLSGLAWALLTLGVAALIGVLSALATTVVSNLRNGFPWNSNLLRGMLYGAGIGIAFAGPGLLSQPLDLRPRASVSSLQWPQSARELVSSPISWPEGLGTSRYLRTRAWQARLPRSASFFQSRGRLKNQKLRHQ